MMVSHGEIDTDDVMFVEQRFECLMETLHINREAQVTELLTQNY